MTERLRLTLVAECPIRVCASLHASGAYRHYTNPKTGRVCCFGPGSEPGEGFEVTVAQWEFLESLSPAVEERADVTDAA